MRGGAVQVCSLCVARVAHHQHLHVRVGHLIQGLALHHKVEAKTSMGAYEISKACEYLERGWDRFDTMNQEGLAVGLNAVCNRKLPNLNQPRIC